MTDEQRTYVNDTREYLQRESMLRVGSHATEKQLLRIIDAQEAELQAARDTIARYEAMIQDIDMCDGLRLLSEEDAWLHLKDFDWGYTRSIGNRRHFGDFYDTALDAYTALKEAT
jgi:hypothetical protein